ncbi:MAG: alpha/beta hydrolase-fold protein, partial [Bacteroidota bacterium]
YQQYKNYQRRQATYAFYRANLTDKTSPNVRILSDTFLVDYLNERRTLRIYLPDDYENSTSRYPVIYLFDGQALFNDIVNKEPEWRVDEVIDSVTTAGGPAAIVVGIDNHGTHRSAEYNPYLTQEEYREINGKQHADWVVNNLKPWIDTSYRTLPDPQYTVVGGASLGGLMSYYMLMTYPTVFQRAIVFSPSFWADESLFHLHKEMVDIDKVKIYMNIGAEEGYPMKPHAKKMARLLGKAGLGEDQLKFTVVPKQGHWHITWRKGFAEAYPWIIE